MNSKACYPFLLTAARKYRHPLLLTCHVFRFSLRCIVAIQWKGVTLLMLIKMRHICWCLWDFLQDIPRSPKAYAFMLLKIDGKIHGNKICSFTSAYSSNKARYWKPNSDRYSENNGWRSVNLYKEIGRSTKRITHLYSPNFERHGF